VIFTHAKSSKMKLCGTRFAIATTSYFEGGTGADAIKSLIDSINFDEEEVKLRDAIENGLRGKPLVCTA
jgi:hypothetical protein